MRVKRNQPSLYRQLKALPWNQVPVQDETHNRGHGRYEIRRLQVLSSDRLDFPHAAQAIRLTRRGWRKSSRSCVPPARAFTMRFYT